jgi:hypothetical protein
MIRLRIKTPKEIKKTFEEDEKLSNWGEAFYGINGGKVIYINEDTIEENNDLPHGAIIYFSHLTQTNIDLSPIRGLDPNKYGLGFFEILGRTDEKGNLLLEF